MVEGEELDARVDTFGCEFCITEAAWWWSYNQQGRPREERG